MIKVKNCGKTPQILYAFYIPNDNPLKTDGFQTTMKQKLQLLRVVLCSLCGCTQGPPKRDADSTQLHCPFLVASHEGLHNTRLHDNCINAIIARRLLTDSVQKYRTLLSLYSIRVNGKIMSDGIDELL